MEGYCTYEFGVYVRRGWVCGVKVLGLGAGSREIRVEGVRARLILRVCGLRRYVGVRL